jgi:SAM-dependent methyltransferase
VRRGRSLTVVRGHPIFAWCYANVCTRAESRDGSLQRRRDGIARARGRVLEIGAGTGLNLPHYRPEAVSEVLATEPDPHMFRRLAAALGASPVPAAARLAEATDLPVPDGWADTVVAWLVLCSVPDPAAALAEVRRATADDGRLIVYEHVRSDAPTFARWQDRLTPAWGWVAAGCHPNRDTASLIEAAGFEWEELERADVPGTGLAKPHIRGVARLSR